MHISPDQQKAARSAAIQRRVKDQPRVDSELQSRAVDELEHRLHDWHGDYVPRTTRFKNQSAVDHDSHYVVLADPVELVIVLAVAMTKGPLNSAFHPTVRFSRPTTTSSTSPTSASMSLVCLRYSTRPLTVFSSSETGAGVGFTSAKASSSWPMGE